MIDRLNICKISLKLKMADFRQSLIKKRMVKNKILTEIKVAKAASGVKIYTFNSPLTAILE